MRIAQIVSGTELNGAVVHCLLLSRELTRRGHEVMLICRPGAWIAGQVGDDGIAVLPSELSRLPPTELRRIAGELRARAIDVVHTHMSRAHFFGILLRAWSGVPCVATAHSATFQLHWMFNDAVIAVSEATGRYQQRRNLVRRSRITTIHNFVDAARIARVAPAAGAALRAELGIDAAAPLVGTVGSVIARKGIADLVWAWRRVVAVHPRARLLVAGDEPRGYADTMRTLAAELGVAASIAWAGRRTDVPAILAALDVFVLASRREAFPLATAEAMAAGLPVVATAVDGLPECIADGETGILIPPADDAALAGALTTLLGDPALRRRLGNAGRARVASHFVADVQVPRIEAVLARAARK